MPIGIIIIAVIGLACFIAAKCCGVHIDPLGELELFIFHKQMFKAGWRTNGMN
jgi:hypothetical protein